MTRDEIKKRVQTNLEKLRKSGTTLEEIAYKMTVSFGTVQNWLKGRRVPKAYAIREIERLYSVKIL